MDCTGCWAPHVHGFWIVPFLFIVLMLVFVAARRRRSNDRRWDPRWRACSLWGPGWGPMTSGWPTEPFHILASRYARGEITQEQYEQMRGNIERGPSRTEPGDSS